MISWFARNPVAANLLMLAAVFTGLLMLLTRIPLEIFPSFEPRVISVSTTLRGASPQEMEQGVSIRIEEALRDLEGIDEIKSVSEEGYANVSLEVNNRYDPRDILADVKNRVDAISTFPADMDRPVIRLPQWRRGAITVAVASLHGDEELRQLADRVRADLLDLPGITQVEISGARAYEVAVDVSAARLQALQLTIEAIGNAIQNSSLDISAGALRTAGGDVLVRSEGQAYRKADFEKIIVLARPDGSLVRLGDVAHIRDGFEETEMITRFNGAPAIMIQVFETATESPLDIAKKVRTYIDSQQSLLPQGVQLSYWGDRSQVLQKRLQTLTENALQGGVLVLLLLTLFLRPAIAFWVFIGVPVSFMGAFLVMPLFGMTINMISLFGFIIVLGIVVDDAIVTGENIYVHLKTGEDPLQAVINGTREVSVPVTFGVLTTMVAFLPMAFIEGARGQLFAQIVVVVLPIFLFSLIESKLILPAHLRNIRYQPAQSAGLSRWQQAFSEGFENWVLRYYQPALAAVISYRYTFVALCFGLLVIVITLLTSGWMKFVFFPRVQSEVAQATLYMPTGTPFEVTDARVESMVAAAVRLRDSYTDLESGRSIILNIQASTGFGDGYSGSHIGSVYFEIMAPEDRTDEITSADLVKAWRQEIGAVPGAEGLNFRAEIGRSSDPIEIHLTGTDYGELSEVAQHLKDKLAGFPVVFDIEDTYSDGKQSFDIQLRPEAIALGLTRSAVLSQLRNGYLGLQVQRIQRGRDEVSVVVRYSREERSSLPLMQDFLISTPGGQKIPLAQLTELTAGVTPVSLYRNNGYRTLTVTSDIDKQQANMLLIQKEVNGFMDDLLVRYPAIDYLWEGEALEQRQSLGSLKDGLLFVIFAIYCLLAVPLKSYIQPLIVMLIIPFSIIGAVAGHWIMGMDMTLISLLGMLALVGVVVNDSLVLVDFVNQRRSKLASVTEAVLVAGASRFRPIMLTTLTTVIGLLPLLLEKSTQAQFLIPMAVSLGFGIAFATVLTLFLVPVNYIIIEDVRSLKRRLAGTA
jgi:multidrug efflux pump subunit AcrB